MPYKLISRLTLFKIRGEKKRTNPKRCVSYLIIKKTFFFIVDCAHSLMDSGVDLEKIPENVILTQ